MFPQVKSRTRGVWPSAPTARCVRERNLWHGRHRSRYLGSPNRRGESTGCVAICEAAVTCSKEASVIGPEFMENHPDSPVPFAAVDVVQGAGREHSRTRSTARNATIVEPIHGLRRITDARR